jgi:hypothetical protein
MHSAMGDGTNLAYRLGSTSRIVHSSIPVHQQQQEVISEVDVIIAEPSSTSQSQGAGQTRAPSSEERKIHSASKMLNASSC